MMEFIHDSEIDNYDDLIGYCIKHKEWDWMDIAANHNTLAINKLFRCNLSKASSKR